MNVESTRVAYGRALCELGERRSDVVVVDADLTTCTMTCFFAQKFPERFFNGGIAESNMVGMGAGLATTGKTVFVNSFAMFSAGRAYDQVRNAVCYPRLNVKVVGTHAGLSVGEDGATHQCIEDISLMRTIPNMTVIVPCDAEEAKRATIAMSEYDGPCYLRLGRSPVPAVTSGVADYDFQIGKASTLKQGTDATIIACGLMVGKAMEAAAVLESTEGLNVRVVDMHTIKPIDKEAILAAARETGAIVTAEEHNMIGGLGAAVCEVLSEVPAECCVPIIKVGVADVFGHSGTAEACLEKYGLTVGHVVDAVKKARSL
ncbi:transketolase family protein [Bifidobacterium lemurum]|nr:transketolase family protein [Bifidobacterium lemurum]